MIRLVKLLTEIENKAKVIIMAGGAGAGKSTLINKFKNSIPDFELINPDKYIEDKDHPLYNNLGGASAQVDDKDVPQAMSGKKNFIWDTTASNANKLFGGTYRRKEVEGILKNPDYDICRAPAGALQISQGKLKEYFEDLIDQDPDKYASTFRRSDKGLSPEELAKKEKQREKTKKQFNNQIQQLEDQFSTIHSQIDELGASDEEVVSKVKSFAN